MRIFLPDYYYHVICRGNNQEDVFLYKRDYTRYTNLLKKHTSDYSVKLVAYCLMPNHIHLLVQPQVENILSRFMQALNIAYVMYFNLKHSRSGHLFQAKFKYSLIETDEYLIHLSRYIHLNPTSSGLVRKPQDYLWSSYRHYLGIERLDFVNEEPILEFFSKKNPRKDYQDFVESRLEYQRELALAKLFLE